LQNDTVERIGILPAHPQNVRRMHAPPLLTSSPRASASAPCPAATCPHHPSNHQSPQTRAPKPLDSGHANARPRCPATGVALRALDCLPQSGGVSLSKAGGRGAAEGSPQKAVQSPRLVFAFLFLMIISTSFGHNNCRKTCIQG
jgi:hypothetical protein